MIQTTGWGQEMEQNCVNLSFVLHLNRHKQYCYQSPPMKNSVHAERASEEVDFSEEGLQLDWILC